MYSYIDMLTMSHDSPKDIAVTRCQVKIAGNRIPFVTSTWTLGEVCKTIDKAQPVCGIEILNQIAHQQVSVH